MRDNWEMLDKILLAIRDEFEQNNEALRRESMALADANRELTRLRAENERLRDLVMLIFYDNSYIESGFDRAHSTEVGEAWIEKLFGPINAELFDKWFSQAYSRLADALGAEHE